jgi:hypothetical protein
MTSERTLSWLAQPGCAAHRKEALYTVNELLIVTAPPDVV